MAGHIGGVQPDQEQNVAAEASSELPEGKNPEEQIAPSTTTSEEDIVVEIQDKLDSVDAAISEIELEENVNFQQTKEATAISDQSEPSDKEAKTEEISQDVDETAPTSPDQTQK